MASDQLVTAAHVLSAVMEYDRRGSTSMIADLERLEPDMVEYLLETLTRLHHNLTDLGLSSRDARRLYHRAEKTAVICIMALRHAHRDLWERDGDTPTAPTDTPPPPSS
jgi:hypothetical protein